jgi:predicted transcriptional regulator of viral defense system
MPSLASSGQPTAEVFFADKDAALARQLQRRAQAGELQRIAPGIYALSGSEEDTRSRVRRHWQLLAGHLIPGAVVSHISAMTRGLTHEGYDRQQHRADKLP